MLVVHAVLVHADRMLMAVERVAVRRNNVGMPADVVRVRPGGVRMAARIAVHINAHVQSWIAAMVMIGG